MFRVVLTRVTTYVYEGIGPLKNVFPSKDRRKTWWESIFGPSRKRLRRIGLLFPLNVHRLFSVFDLSHTKLFYGERLVPTSLTRPNLNKVLCTQDKYRIETTHSPINTYTETLSEYWRDTGTK